MGGGGTKNLTFPQWLNNFATDCRPAHLSPSFSLPLNLSFKKLPDFQRFSTSRSKITSYFLTVPFIPLCLAGKHRRYHTSRITTTTTNCLRVLRNLHRFPTFSDWVATFYDRFRTPLRQREQCGDWFRTRQQGVSDFYEWIQLCNNSGAIQSCTDYDANR